MAKPQMKKRTITEHRLGKPHGSHGKHLCSLVADREMQKVADYAEGAKFICNICGRAASKPDYLCEPVMI